MAFIMSTLYQNYNRHMSRSLRIVKYRISELSSNIPNAYKETVIIPKTDPLNTFTCKLMQEKIEKWKILNTSNIKSVERRLVPHDICKNPIKSCDDNDIIIINGLIRKAIDSKSYQAILSLLKACDSKNICPSSALLLEIAGIFSRQGNKNGVEAVQLVCKSHNQNEYIVQAEYKHYMAEATWVSGNVEEALRMFEDVYKNYISLQRRVRNMTKFLVAECVSNRSEASLVLVTDFAKKFATEYGDFYILACLWQYLFLSEWFTDQKLANEIIDEYSELRTKVVDRLQFIAAIAIDRNETDIVQRLFTVALRYKMKKQYACILRSFFDYKCSVGDLRSCIEILASALDEDVTLTNEQQNKFLILLLSTNNGHFWFYRRRNIEHLFKQLKVPLFQMKF